MIKIRAFKTSKLIKKGDYILKNNKLKNIKSEYKGMIFDSTAELSRFQDLVIKEKGHYISDLRKINNKEKTFILIEKQTITKNDKKIVSRAMSYTPDFVYQEGGYTVYEDVKGLETEAFKLKKKILLQKLKEHKKTKFIVNFYSKGVKDVYCFL